MRGGGHGSPQSSGGRRVCYGIPDQTEAEASDAIITGMILMCNHSTLVLFDLNSTYLYASVYFVMDLDIVCEPLTERICLFTLVGESLVVN